MAQRCACSRQLVKQSGRLRARQGHGHTLRLERTKLWTRRPTLLPRLQRQNSPNQRKVM